MAQMWQGKACIMFREFLRHHFVSGLRTLNPSGVTRVGVTRGGNWRCHPYFLRKNWRSVFALNTVAFIDFTRMGVTPLAGITPDLFYVTDLVCPLQSATRGGSPALPSDATPLLKTIKTWKPKNLKTFPKNLGFSSPVLTEFCVVWFRRWPERLSIAHALIRLVVLEVYTWIYICCSYF